MSDLSYTIEVKGVQDLDKLANTIDKVTGVLNAGVGSGKSLEELRKILVGLKGKGSALEELATAAKGFTDATAEMRKGIGNNFKGLERLLKSEFAQLRNVMQQGGAAAGMAAGQGMAQGISEAGKEIEKSTRSLSAKARKEQTKLYEAFVGNNAYTTITKDMVDKLFNFQQAGAAISAYHQGVLRTWKASNKQATDEMLRASESEETRLQAWLQAKDSSTKRDMSIAAGYARRSLERGKFYVGKVKADLAEEAAQLKAAAKTEEDRLQAWLQSKDAEVKRELSIAKGYAKRSLERGKFYVGLVKSELAKEVAELKTAAKTEEDRLQVWLKAKDAESKQEISIAAGYAKESLRRGNENIKLIKAALAKEVAEIKNAIAEAQRQIRYAQSAPSGSFTRLSDRGLKIIPNSYGSEDLQAIQDAAKPPKSPKLEKTAQGMREVTKAGNDMHSMARGLASGFNLLWLTWGSLGPLLAGATISNGLMQTARNGMAVAHVMETIAVVGGNTADEMNKLNMALDALSVSGPVGPLEVAEAMKVLSLAGLKANEIVAVTKDVLNFSVAGTTELKTAAETLMAVSTAFGLGADGFGRVADVISKAAAESMTSVENFSSAMKTASVINAQYGVSLEDTAVGLAALAQLGIQGTAAGTALRNMYADLSGRSMQVAKVLKQQGIELRDLRTGGFRPLLEVVDDLNNKFKNLDAISQKNLMQALLSERGAKGIVEMLRLINTEAKNMGDGLGTALDELKAKIADNEGFAAVTAARMAQTAENQFKQVKAVLQTSMLDAYRAMEPALIVLADALKTAFSDESFKRALTSLVVTIANIGTVIVEHSKEILALGVAYAAWKTVQLASIPVMNAYRSAMALKTAATTADTTATVANTAATTAANGAWGTAALWASRLGRFIPYVGQALAVGAGAWAVYEGVMKSSNETAKQAADISKDNIVKSLNEQAEKLEYVNALRAEGLSLQEAEARFANLNPARMTELAKARAELQSAKFDYEKPGNTPAQLMAATSRSAAAQAVINRYEQEDKDIAKAIKRIKDASSWGNATQDWEAMANKARLAAMNGTGVFTLADARAGSERNELKAVSAVRQNLMRETEEANRNELASLKAHYESKQRLLKSEADNQLITQGEFVMREIALTQESEAKQLQTLLEGKERYKEAYASQANDLAASYAEWTQNNPQATAEQFEKQAQDTATALQNLARDYSTTVAKMDQDGKAIKDNALERLTMSANKAKGELIALGKQFADFWKKEEARAAQQARSVALEDQLRFASPEQAAYIQAVANEFERLQPEIEKTERELDLLNKSWEFFIALEAASGALSSEQQIQFDALREKVRLYREEIEKLRQAQGQGSATAGQDALTKFGKDESKRLTDGIADATLTGLIEGGKAGRKKLRDLVVNELLKPVTLVVNAVVNTLLGPVLGALGLGGAGSAAAGLAGSAGGSILGSLGSFGTAVSGFGTAAGYGASALMAGNGLGAISGGMSMIGAGSVAQGVGMVAGVVGPIVLGIAALASIIKSMKTPGEQHTGGFYSSSGRDGMGAALSVTGGDAAAARDLIKRANPEMEKLVKATVDSVIKSSTAQAKILGMDIAVGIDAGLAANTNGKAKNKNAFGYFDVTINGETVAEYVNRELGEDVTKAVETWTTAMHDAVAGFVLQGTDFSKAGETSSQTLARLASSLTAVNQAFDFMGRAAIQASVAGGAFASDIVDAFGGLENFSSVHASYFQEFYTEAERVAYASKTLTTEFGKLGIAVPASRQEFRSLVDSVDLSTEAGRNLYVELLKLAPGFDMVADAAEAAAEKVKQEGEGLYRQLLEAQGNTAELRRLELEALDPANRAMQVRIWALEDEKTAAQEAADAAQELRDKFEALASAGGNIAAFILDLKGGDAGLATPLQKVQETKKAYEADLKLAKLGDIDASNRVSSSGRAYIDALKGYSASGDLTQTAIAKMIEELGALPAVKSYDQLMLEKLNDISQGIIDLNGELVVKLAVETESQIRKIVEFVTDTDQFPADLKELALTAASTLKKTVDYVVGTALSPELKLLALNTTSSLAKTVNYILGSALPADLKKLALDTATSLTKTVDYIVGTQLPANEKTLALATASSLSKTVNYIVGTTLSTDLKTLALTTVGKLDKTVNYIVGTQLPTDLKTLALTTVGKLDKTVNYIVGSKLTDSDKALALSAVGKLDKTVNYIAGSQLSADDKKIALAATESITKTIGAAAGAMDANALKVALAQADTINRIITASGGVLTEDQRILLNDITEYNKEVFLKLTVDSSSLATAEQLLQNAFGDILQFDPADPLLSIFKNISMTNNIMIEQFKKWLEVMGGLIVEYDKDTGTLWTSEVYGIETNTDRAAGAAGFPGMYVLQYDATNYLEQIRDVLVSVVNGTDSLLTRTGGSTSTSIGGSTTTTSTTSQQELDAIWSYVQTQDWSATGTAGALANLYLKSIQSGWTQEEIAKAVGSPLADVQSLFADYGYGSFATGGYTGAGGKYDYAGAVHRGEIVWSQEDIARWGGVGVVESMRGGAVPAVAVSSDSDNEEIVMELRAMRQALAEVDNTVVIKVVTPDGRAISEQTMKAIRERSRRGELVVYADGVR